MANENNYDVYKPEWIPEGGSKEQYPGFVMTGVNAKDAKPKAPIDGLFHEKVEDKGIYSQ